ncbi:MAG: hypothetical protein JW990_21805 [Thermoleophilia bacterium]|nr:hypothetical protein [Thermoleophilia bacterium]
MANEHREGSVRGLPSEDNVVRRLRAGFSPEGPDQATRQRIYHKAVATRDAGSAREAAAAGSRRAGATRQTRGTRPVWKWAPIAACLVVALLAGTFVLTSRDTADAATIAKRALAAVQQTGAVTHYKMSGSFADMARPEAEATWEADYWVDHENQAYSYRVRNLLHVNGAPVSGLTKGGAQPVPTIFSAGLALEDVADSPVDLEAAYNQMIASGSAQLLGEETIDGTPTYQLQITREETWGSDPLHTVKTIYVSKSDYLPVRMIEESILTTPAGDLHTKETVSLTEVGVIEREALPAGLFAIQTPTGEEHVEGTLTTEQVQAFTEFDLFWLGETIEGLKLDSIRYGRESDGAAKEVWPSFRVQFAYSATDGGASSSLYVTVAPRVADEWKTMLVGADLTTREVAGATVYLADTFEGTAAIVDKGDATVVMTADDEASVLGAAARLTAVSDVR